MNINLELVNMIPRISKQPIVVAVLNGVRRLEVEYCSGAHYMVRVVFSPLNCNRNTIPA